MAITLAKLILKRTSSPGSTPPADFLEQGELALNYGDGRLYYKGSDNAVHSVVVDTSAFAELAANQTFSGINTFSNDAIFSGTVAFNGVATFTEDAVMVGAALSGNLSVEGTTTLTDTLTANGTSTFNDRATFKSVEMTVLALAISAGDIDWDCALGNVATVTMTSDATLTNPTNVGGGSYILKVTQDATGSRVLSLGSNFKTVDGSGIEISPDANSISILTFVSFGGTDLYLNAQQNFA